jgi:hypothetical protein
VVGLIVWAACRPAPAFPPVMPEDGVGKPPDSLAPFDGRSLAVAVLVLVVILTGWRNLSNMSRLVFPSWPLLVLGIVGGLRPLLAVRPVAVIRVVAVLGALLFLVVAGVTYHAKGGHARAQAYAAQHPYLSEVSYQSFWGREAGRSYGRLGTRARYEVTVFGPPSLLYPSSVYEEDPFKVLVYRTWLAHFGLADVLTGESLVYSAIFFEDSRTPPDTLPPPGTPEAPDVVHGADTEGRPFTPRIHPDRGIELRFPARAAPPPAELSASFVLPAGPAGERVAGFELLAFTPYVPPGARLTVTAFDGAQSLGSAPVPIVGSEGHQAHAAMPLYGLPPPRPEPFRVVRWPLGGTATQREIRVVLRLEVPPGAFRPSVACYIRRPFIATR